MTILFADDHQLILDGLISLIKTNFKSPTVYTATNKSELMHILETQDIDVLIQDIKFGEDNAKTFLGDIKKNFPSLRILVLSTISDTISIQQFQSKAHGYVLKSEPIEEIIKAIKNLNFGNFYLSPASKRKIEAFFPSEEIVLTRREKEVLAVIMEEKSIREIAEKLFISEKTVEMHRSNLFLKLDVKNITGLVKKVISLGLIEE